MDLLGLGAEGIYVLKFGKFTDVYIEFLEFATDKTHRSWTLQKEPGWGLSLSSDGQSIVYIQDEFAESTENLRLQFRSEFPNAFNPNAFNHVNLNTPNSSCCGGTMDVTSKSSSPRIIQFGRKLYYCPR